MQMSERSAPAVMRHLQKWGGALAAHQQGRLQATMCSSALKRRRITAAVVLPQRTHYPPNSMHLWTRPLLHGAMRMLLAPCKRSLAGHVMAQLLKRAVQAPPSQLPKHKQQGSETCCLRRQCLLPIRNAAQCRRLHVLMLVVAPLVILTIVQVPSASKRPLRLAPHGPRRPLALARQLSTRTLTQSLVTLASCVNQQMSEPRWRARCATATLTRCRWGGLWLQVQGCVPPAVGCSARTQTWCTLCFAALIAKDSAAPRCCTKRFTFFLQ